MSLFGKKKKAQDTGQEYRTRDFFDCILPGTIKFFANSYIVGDTYRCVWVIREYPPTTEEQAILAQLADRTGITLRLYHRRVTPVEEKQIVNNAARKNRLMAGDHDITQAMEAEGNLQDVQTLLATMRNNREILLHCSVYMELKAKSMETLEQLQSQIAMELTRAKITVDKAAQYPDNVGIYEEYIRSHYLGKRTADCAGFIKGYCWYNPETDSVNYATNGMPDLGANQMYQTAMVKGPISTMPEIPGLAVWHQGHIGVYIGNGYAIEAMGTRYGVVKTRVASRSWTHWLKIPYINYIEETEEES